MNAQDIRTALTAFDNLGHSRTVSIGIKSTATDGIDPGLGEFVLGPTIPGIFDIRIVDVDIRPVPLLGNGVWTDLRGIFTGPPIVQQYEIIVRRAIGATSTYLSWPLPLSIGVTTAHLAAYPDPSILDVDMGSMSQVLLPTSTNRYVLTVTYGGPALQRYTLNTQVDPAGQGQVIAIPTQPDYASGSTVTLFALNAGAPDTCYAFSRWSGDATGTNPITSITMDASKSVTANFALRTFPVSISALDTFKVTGTMPPPQTLRIANSGLACYAWTATASDPWIGISKGNGIGDDSIRVTVIASSLPCAGTHIGTITIRSNAALPNAYTVPVIVTVGNSGLAATVHGQPLILSCESKANDFVFVTVFNSTLSPVTFPSAPASGAGFLFKNPEIFPLTIQANDSARLYYEFRPDASQRGVIVDNIILTSSSCGKQVLFKLQGTRVAPTVTSNVNELDFGKINACASDPLPSRSIVLTNAHSQPAQLRYALPSGFTFTTQPASIPAGGSAMITLQPVRLGVPAFDDTIAIEADFGVCQEHFPVRLFGQRQTAALLVDAASSPGSLPPQLFDTTCVGSYSQPKAIRISNTGTADLVITLAIAAPFEIDAFSSPITIPAGEAKNVNLRFHPTVAGSFTQSLTISADQCLLSSVVTLRGSTFSQQILTAAIAPANVALANCEPEARVQITVTNTGTQPAIFDALPALPSGFFWDSTITVPVVIPANAATPFIGSIVFRPELGRGGSFGGSVDWFGQPCGTSAYFTLSGSRVLPQIALTPRAIDFGTIIDCGGAAALPGKTVTVTNVSALPITLTALAPTAGYTLLNGAAPFPTQGLSVPANASQDITVMPKTGSGGAFLDTLVLGIFAGAGGTCSETMSVPMTGERFRPSFSLRDPLVDAFDGVCVGTKTVQSWLIENTGDKTIMVTSTAFPSSSVFSLLANPYRVTIEPGKTKELPIRYSPTAVGSQSAILTLTSDACPTGITYTFKGKAVQPSFSITGVTPDGPLTILTCEQSRSAQISATVTNSGTDPVTIADGSIPPEGFRYDPAGQFPFTLRQGEKKDVTLRFVGTEPGSYGGTVRLFASVCGGEASFPLQVTLVKTGYAVTPDALPFGTITICPDGAIREGDLEKMMADVDVRNTGSVPMSFTLAINPAGGAFRILAPLASPFTLAPGTSQKVTVGIANPIDSMTTDLRGVLDVTVQPAGGNAACLPELVSIPLTASVQRVGFAFIGDSATATATCGVLPVTLKARLLNTGTAPTQFTFSIAGSTAFVVIDSVKEPVLQPGTGREILILYTPDSLEAPNAVLTARDKFCQTEAAIPLSVTARQLSVSLSCSETGAIGAKPSGRPGDHILIPLFLSTDVRCDAVPMVLSFLVKYDHFSLTPVKVLATSGTATLTQKEAGQAIVTLTGTSFTKGDFATIEMEILVGKIRTPFYTFMTPVITPPVGQIKLDANCTGTVAVSARGGIGTLKDLGIAGFYPPRPNLLTSEGQETSIDFSLATDCIATMKVYDRLGNAVATVFDGAMEKGEHTISWRPQGLPAGMYLVALSTGTEILTQKLIVAR